jgi:20S proteasome alpha/beta subunit
MSDRTAAVIFRDNGNGQIGVEVMAAATGLPADMARAVATMLRAYAEVGPMTTRQDEPVVTVPPSDLSTAS